MPTIYNFSLTARQAEVFAEILDWVDEDLVELQGFLLNYTPAPDSEPVMTTVTEHRQTLPEVNENLEVVSLLREMFKEQHRTDRTAPWLMPFEVDVNDVLPLKDALLAQINYARRQHEGYVRILASVPKNENIQGYADHYKRQLDAMLTLMVQLDKVQV